MPEVATLPLLTPGRTQVGQVEVRADVFSAPVRPYLLHSVVRMQLANRRAGTHSTKTRGEVSGGGKKPWRQKGTGRARAGSTRSPLWVGGAVVFGPKPRDYSYRMPHCARVQALRSALSYKVKTNELLVTPEISLERPKTRLLVEFLGRFGLDSVLVVLPERDEKVERAGRNLQNVKVVSVAGLNVYDILRYRSLLTTPEGLKAIEGRVG